MLDIIFTVIIYLAGAITEYETKGKVTEVVLYQDGNKTEVECHEVSK